MLESLNFDCTRLGIVRSQITEVEPILRDADMLPRVQKAAELMLDAHPANIAPLLARWIGYGERFGKV